MLNPFLMYTKNIHLRYYFYNRQLLISNAFTICSLFYQFTKHSYRHNARLTKTDTHIQTHTKCKHSTMTPSCSTVWEGNKAHRKQILHIMSVQESNQPLCSPLGDQSSHFNLVLANYHYNCIGTIKHQHF